MKKNIEMFNSYESYKCKNLPPKHSHVLGSHVYPESNNTHNGCYTHSGYHAHSVGQEPTVNEVIAFLSDLIIKMKDRVFVNYYGEYAYNHKMNNYNLSWYEKEELVALLNDIQSGNVSVREFMHMCLQVHNLK